jgi:hypothetical protein
METIIKFKAGEIVMERIHPAQKLVVSYYLDKIYYCKAQEHRHCKDLVYFERELLPDSPE